MEFASSLLKVIILLLVWILEMDSTHRFCGRGKKIKLTKTTVENLPHAEKGKQVEYFDTELEGSGVRDLTGEDMC
jgi:hypothetical protein